MTDEQVAAQETETQEQETAQEEVNEQTPDAEEVFKELPVEDEESFDEQLNDDEPDEGEAEDELDGDKRTLDHYKREAEFYKKKARRVDSIEAVDKAVKKYSLTSPEVQEHLKEMAKKGRPKNEIFERAKFANKLINAERNQLKAQLEKTYGSLENFKAQAKAEAESQVANSWGKPDAGNKAPDTMVDWEQVKDLPVSEQLKVADKLKPIDRSWIGKRPK